MPTPAFSPRAQMLFTGREFTALPMQPAAVEPVMASTVAVSQFARPSLASSISTVAVSQFVAPSFASSIASTVARETPFSAVALLRPELIDAVVALQPRESGDRASFDVAICPQKDVVDSVLFEDAKTPEVRFYLPRYRVRHDGEREVIRLSKQGAAWELALELEAFVSPALGDVGAAGPLPHSVGVVLHYQVGDGQFTRQFVVTDTPEGHKRAVLALADADERNVIYTALIDDSLRARLVVRRFVSVAIPSDEVAPPPPPAPGTFFRVAPVQQFVAQNVALANVTDQRVIRGPALGTAALRVPIESPPIIPQPPESPEPAAPRYRKIDTSVDHDERQRFVFPRALYEYVFSEIEGGAGEVAFRVYYVAFEGRQHRYYRDPMDRRVFHFLPDGFKIARQPAPPHAPTLLMRFLPGVQGLDDMRVQLDYFAVPHIDPERLEHAARELPALLDGDPLKPGQTPAFKSLSPPRDQLKLRIGLPGSQPGPSSGLREGAQVELSTVASERLTLSLLDFQALWASLFSSTPVLFQGSIEVTLSDGVEQIPFVGRMDDLEGPTVETAERLLTGGEVDVTLTNTCESPVTLHGIEAFVVGPDGPVACTLTGIDPTAPLPLASGAAVDLHLVPVSPVPVVTDALVRFDTVDVEPDKEAVYQAILDTSVPLDFLRTITVRGKHLFDAAKPEDPLIAVLVEFECGSTAELTPSAPDGQGLVRLPLRDYVLGSMSTADVANASYRYRMTLVHGASGQQRSRDWDEATTEILYPVVVATAPPAPAAPTPP
jgi:hypothetical protein